MTREEAEARDLGVAAAIAGAVRAASRLFGRHGGSGKTHARIRAAKAAAAARAAANASGKFLRGRTFSYEQPQAVYATQPSPPVYNPYGGPIQPGMSDLLNLYLWYQDLQQARDASHASAQQAVTDAAPWWAVPDVIGPPGAYEAGMFYGVNNPLLRGSRQDPRGIYRPPTLRSVFA